MAGKKRAGELDLFEKDARRMTPEQEQAEIAAAKKAAVASGRYVGKATALSMKEHEQGYATSIVSGMDAVLAAQHYMHVLHATAIDGRGHVDDVSSYPTDDELAGVVVPQTARFGDNPALDGALKDEHWAAPQDAHVRDAAADTATTVSLHDSRGHTVGMLLVSAKAAKADKAQSVTIDVIHVRTAWRRRQLAEVLWRSFLREQASKTFFYIEAACCQAVHASSFWHRMGFQLAKAATDLMKKVERRNMPKSIVVGDYIMTYTKP